LEDHERSGMYDVLLDVFGEDEVKDVLEQQAIAHITNLYDNREKLKNIQSDDGNI